MGYLYAITHRLYKVLIILNSAAFKFNILYKFLSNKKVAQDFVMSDFSLTLVLQIKTSKNRQ